MDIVELHRFPYSLKLYPRSYCWKWKCSIAIKSNGCESNSNWARFNTGSNWSINTWSKVQRDAQGTAIIYQCFLLLIFEGLFDYTEYCASSWFRNSSGSPRSYWSKSDSSNEYKQTYNSDQVRKLCTIISISTGSTGATGTPVIHIGTLNELPFSVLVHLLVMKSFQGQKPLVGHSNLKYVLKWRI